MHSKKKENGENLFCNNPLRKGDGEVFLYSRKFHFKSSTDIYLNVINSMHTILCASSLNYLYENIYIQC